MIRLVMHHDGSTQTREIDEEKWPMNGNLEDQLRVAIGAWCNNIPGERWPGRFDGPILFKEGGKVLSVNLGARNLRYDFDVTLPDIGGPW